MLRHAIRKLVEGRNLTEDEVIAAMNVIMEGDATPSQIAGFITALRIKGESIEEITGCAKVMREKSSRILPNVDYYIDTCGTGGDGTNTFNISTAAALVAAAGGVVVAKHGNRSISSKSGSADVLEALGVNIALTPKQVEACIEKVGIGFMFAPNFHPSMKYAAGPRKELGIRTIFNVLGPLTNPANASGQVLGIFDERLVEPMAHVLRNLNIERAMVVHGLDGMDEITTTGTTTVAEVRNGKVICYTLQPEDFDISIASREDLAGGDACTNAKLIYDILEGKNGPQRDIVVMNAAAALYIGKVAESFTEGVHLAGEILDSGKALTVLHNLKEFTNKPGVEDAVLKVSNQLTC